METTNNLIEILESKTFVKNGNPFKSPSELLNPIIDIFGNDNITGFGTHPVTINDNDDNLTAFGRCGVIKHIPIDNEMSYQIGFMYSLEQGKPFVKIFSGFNISICSNMCIFGSKNTQKFDLLTQGTDGAYSEIENYLNNSSKNIEEGIKLINEMKNTILNREEVKNFLGEMCLNFSATKNVAGTSTILNASKLLTTKGDRHYFDEETTAWNVFNSLTDGYRDKTHILDQPEKVRNIYNVLKANVIKNTQMFLN
jgi:hypothetical protein